MEANDHVVGPRLEHVLEEELREEILLYDKSDRRLISLNESAADIWRLCTGEFTTQEIVERVAGFYDEGIDDVREPVESTIQEFVQIGVIPPIEDNCDASL